MLTLKWWGGLQCLVELRWGFDNSSNCALAIKFIICGLCHMLNTMLERERNSLFRGFKA